MKKYIVLLLIPNLLLGQNELSLIDAIRLGMWQNYEIQISKKKKKISTIQNNWANANALPIINISAKKEEVLSDQSNNPTAFIKEKLRLTSYNSNANLSWTLFNGFAKKRSYYSNSTR